MKNHDFFPENPKNPEFINEKSEFPFVSGFFCLEGSESWRYFLRFSIVFLWILLTFFCPLATKIQSITINSKGHLDTWQSKRRMDPKNIHYSPLPSSSSSSSLGTYNERKKRKILVSLWILFAKCTKLSPLGFDRFREEKWGQDRGPMLIRRHWGRPSHSLT